MQDENALGRFSWGKGKTALEKEKHCRRQVGREENAREAPDLSVNRIKKNDPMPPKPA